MRVSPAPLLLLAAAAFVAACGTADDAPLAPPPKTVAALPTARATFAMQTRDYKVTFMTGDRVRVEGARGELVADGVTVESLERVDPFLYAACRSATANGGPYLDASLGGVGPARSPAAEEESPARMSDRRR